LTNGPHGTSRQNGAAYASHASLRPPTGGTACARSQASFWNVSPQATRSLTGANAALMSC